MTKYVVGVFACAVALCLVCPFYLWVYLRVFTLRYKAVTYTWNEKCAVHTRLQWKWRTMTLNEQLIFQQLSYLSVATLMHRYAASLMT